MKPIIGIVAKLLSDFECPGDIWSELYVKEEFREIVVSCGGLAIGLLPPFHSGKFNPDESDRVFVNNLTPEEQADLDAILGLCGGFILQGGLSADYYELYIARYALSHNIPILAVCAGFNTLARAVGGDIVSFDVLGLPEGLHNVYSTDYRHEISLRKDSPLYETFPRDTMRVNSLHTQFLSKAYLDAHPAGLEINATASYTLADGSICTTVEAFTVPGQTFAMGVKWHPELMGGDHKQKLFGRFLSACGAAQA